MIKYVRSVKKLTSSTYLKHNIFSSESETNDADPHDHEAIDILFYDLKIRNIVN